MLAFVGLSTTCAQVGIGTSTPHASAVLEVSSTNKGFLPPRMTEENRQDISAPATGLIIYCTDCGEVGELQVYNGTTWTNLEGNAVGVNPWPTGSVYCNNTPTLINEVTNPVTNKTWMDRNLGASQVATSSTDADSYGDLYQWGRGSDGHQCINSAITNTLSISDQPLHGNFILAPTSPGDWRSTQNDNLWQGITGTNNPCPTGYRLPTETEWLNEINTWANTSDRKEDAFNSILKLSVAGRRKRDDNGSLERVDERGFFWSSTVSAASARRVGTRSSEAAMSTSSRAYGISVRCIKH